MQKSSLWLTSACKASAGAGGACSAGGAAARLDSSDALARQLTTGVHTSGADDWSTLAQGWLHSLNDPGLEVDDLRLWPARL